MYFLNGAMMMQCCCCCCCWNIPLKSFEMWGFVFIFRCCFFYWIRNTTWIQLFSVPHVESRGCLWKSVMVVTHCTQTEVVTWHGFGCLADDYWWTLGSFHASKSTSSTSGSLLWNPAHRLKKVLHRKWKLLVMNDKHSFATATDKNSWECFLLLEITNQASKTVGLIEEQGRRKPWSEVVTMKWFAIKS